jgi:pimeloyl-ACP methyl ester carboxylesterase
MTEVGTIELVEQTVDVDGETVEWHVAGSGAPLVCVHGLGGSWRWWLPVLPELADSHEVHLVDLPHFSAIGGFGPEDASAWLERWLEEAGIERPALMGHSLGGLLAAELATRVELDRLVLVAPAGLPTGRDVLEEVIALAHALRRTATPFLATIGLEVLRWGPAALFHGAQYVLSADLTEELGDIAAPTLLVWGADDDLVPVAQSEVWEDEIPDARLVVLPHAAHIPMVEAPDEFAETVLDFLAAPLEVAAGVS